MADLDITGWSEERILAWEAEHEQFATDERANAAADAWLKENITPEDERETEYWKRFYSEEAERA